MASGAGVADGARARRSAPAWSAACGGCRDARRSGSCRRRPRPARGPAGARAHRRSPAAARARPTPTPCTPTTRRALFIIVNMQARPRFSSPTSQPTAPALAEAAVAIDHGAGRRAVDAELVLDAGADDVVARAERAVGVGQELRHEEQRDAARAGRRVGQPRQHEVDDVFGEVVLAIGDEDLLAEDAVGAVAAPLGAGASARRDRSRPAARSGSSSPSTRPTTSLRQVERLQLRRVPCAVERLDRAHGQQRAEREGHAGGVPHLCVAAVTSVSGSPWPPNASGAARPFQPPAHQSR